LDGGVGSQVLVGWKLVDRTHSRGRTLYYREGNGSQEQCGPQ